MTSIIKVDQITPNTSGGFVDIPAVFSRIQAASNFNATYNAWTEVPYDTVVYDTHSLADLSNNGFTIPSGLGGYYNVQAFVRANGWLADRFIIQLHIDGTDDIFFEAADHTDTASKYGSLQLNGVVRLTDGQTATIELYHSYGSSGTQSVYGGAVNNWFQISRLGSA